MKRFIEKKPLLLSGLALGLAALGNLLGQYGNPIRFTFGGLSFGIFCFITYYIISRFDLFKEEMSNPVVASIFGTYSMSGILLSTYLKVWFSGIATVLWWVFVVMHIALIIFFTIGHASKRNILTVYPSWFIVYVGIVVASLTAPAHNAAVVGQIAFWFGLIAYIILLPIVFYRLVKIKQIPMNLMPNLAINSAPASLLLAGYLNVFQNHNDLLVMILLVLSQIIFIYVVLTLIKLMTKEFLPSFSAFTFPFAITAISLNAAANYFSWTSGFATVILTLEIWFAVMMVSYATIGFLHFYLKD